MPGERNVNGFRIEDLLVHREWVARLARALVRSDADAGDAEQEVWLRALEHPPAETPRSPRAWLRTLLRFTAVDRLRADATRRRHEVAAARPDRVEDSPSDLVARAETLDRLVHAVLDLPEPYRETILLRFFEDLGPGDIAARRGIPVETVRTRVRRGVALLRERFDGESGGNRKEWSLLLLPLLRRPGPPVAMAGAGAAVVLGGVLMAKKAVAAGVVVVLGLAAWLFLREVGPVGGDGGSGAPSASASRTPSAPTPVDPKGVDLPPSAPRASSPGPRIVGLVVDPEGAGIAGAAVVAIPEREGQSISGIPLDAVGIDAGPGTAVAADAGGRFSLALEEGVPLVRIGVRAPGFAPRVAGPGRPGVDVRLGLSREGGLEGTVRDRDGRPVEGACLRFSCVLTTGIRARAEALSGPDGGYRLTGLPTDPGVGIRGALTAVLDVRADGFAPLLLGNLSYLRLLPSLGPGRVSRLDLVLLRGLRILGKVVEEATGDPVPGASVAFLSFESSMIMADATSAADPRFLARAVSSPDGTFVLEHLPVEGPQGVMVNSKVPIGFVGAWKDGWSLGTARIPVRGDGETLDVTVSLLQAAVVEGRVVDARGAPAAGIFVAASSGEGAPGVQGAAHMFGTSMPEAGFPSGFAWTGRDGRFRVGGVPLDGGVPAAGRVGAQRRADRGYGGRWDAVAPVDLRPGETTVVGDLALPDPDPAALVPFLVVDGEGRGIAGASLRREDLGYDPSGGWRSDGTGRCLIPREYLRKKSLRQADGEVETGGGPGEDSLRALTVQARGFASVRVPVTPEILREGTSADEVRVVLATGGRIGGRVLDGAGNPLAGAEVAILDGTAALDAIGTEKPPLKPDGTSALLGSARTAADGSFLIEDLPDGACHVTARVMEAAGPSDFRPRVAAQGTATPVAPGALDVELVLALSTSPGAVVEVVVRAVDTGLPVDGASARLSGADRGFTGTATAPGRIRFEGVPAGEWRVIVEARGFGRGSALVEVREGTVPAAIEVQVVRGATVTGTVVPQDGGAAEGGRVYFFPVTAGDALETSLSGEVEKDGLFRVEGVPPGAYRPLALWAGRTRRSLVPGGGVLLRVEEGEREVRFPLVAVPAGTLVVRGEDTAKERGPGRLVVTGSSGVVQADLRVEVGPGRTSLFASYLLPGSYDVRVETPGGSSTTDAVVREGGETVAVVGR